MSLDLDAVRARRSYVTTMAATIAALPHGVTRNPATLAALGTAAAESSNDVDDLVAEIESLRTLRMEIDQGIGGPATIKVWRDGVLRFNGVDYSALVQRDDLEAERDRYRAEWEEAARHALRWQAEYDTAQQEIERLHFAIDGLAANAAGYQRGEVEQAGQARRAERERDDGRAQVASVEALCEMRDHVSGAPGNGIVATASVMRALRGPETSGAVSTAGTGDAANPRRAGVDAPAPEPEGYYEVCVDPDTARLSAKQGDGS